MKPSQFFTDTSSLQQIESDCWALLTTAANDPKCDFRLPVLGTQSPTGVAQRIVVLRAADANAGWLLIHTDARSAKVRQLKDTSVATLLFYDKAKKVQLRVTANASIHTDDSIADQLWQFESATSLKGYLGPLAPGTVCAEAEHNLAAEFIESIPDRSQLEAAREHFAAVRFSVTQLDWLQLNRTGHLQAQFHYDAHRIVSRTWTAP